MFPKTGAMNHPQRNIVDEISWISKNSFDFIDLTIEPTKAGQFDVAKAKKALRDSGLGIIGHTTPFLPFALPVSSIRHACMKEFTKYAKIFSRLEAEYVNIHPAYNMPFHSTDEKIEANISFMSDFSKIAGKALQNKLNTVFYKTSLMPAWRSGQTRRSRKPLPSQARRFESCRRRLETLK